MSNSLRPDSGRHHLVQTSLKGLIYTTVLALVVPAIMAVIVAAGSDANGWTDGVRWILYMITVGAVAAIFGVIFGVPKARTDFDAEPTERYASNSNLEQISDWLTKLLVGAGLVQLASLPGLLAKTGEYLGRGMSMENSAAFSTTAIVYGAAMGFAAGHLWTRVRFRSLLEASDSAAAAISAKRDHIVSALREAEQGSAQPASDEELQQVAATALQAASNPINRFLPILWVDDRPANNRSIIDALVSIGIRVDLALTTAEAKEKLRLLKYGAIISDLGRVENGQDNRMAGLEFIQFVRQSDLSTPIFVYAGKRGLENEALLTEAGATRVMPSASHLYYSVLRAVAGNSR